MTQLRVLHIEDADDDHQLVCIELERMGFDVDGLRIETEAALHEALSARAWDVVLCDDALPLLDVRRALAILHQHGLDVPFIILSGTMDPRRVVDAMKAGAHDFVSKNDAGRLDPVLRRELREAANRRAKAAAERELVVVNRRKDEFLALLGHELRNPLAPIVTAVHLLKQQGPPPLELLIIERQSQHLLRLVNDLLDVSTIIHGKVLLDRHPVEVGALVKRAIEQADRLIESRRHTLCVEVADAGLAVDVDAARLVQVFANLLTNAARYTPEGGRIDVCAKKVGCDVVVVVGDNGSGITADLLPSIFEVFVQGPRALARSEGGLGLGLALVHNLVQLHDGGVSAESDGAGRGSRFTVRLPHVVAVEVVAPPPPPPLALSQGTRILIVDDNDDATTLLALVLRAAGYVVETAEDGAVALQCADDFAPDAVVLDIGLPGIDGFEVARRLRAQPRHARIKIFGLSGYGQAADHARAFGAGFDRHFVKPLAPGILLEALHALGDPA